MTVNCILAVDSNFGISREGVIPWSIPEDMAFFRNTTMNKIVVMGKNTYLSLPNKVKPLPGRLNCIISTTIQREDVPLNVLVFPSLNDCIKYFNKILPNEEIFIIGGSQLYNEAFKHKDLVNVYLTQINKDYNTDNFIEKSFLNRVHSNESCRVFENNGVICTINKLTFENNKEEQQYLDLLSNVIQKPIRDTRNATTFSDFGYTLEFNLSDRFPMLTTKRVYWRGVVEELLFFLRGETDASKLSAKKVKIWDPNTTREFLDNRNLKHYSIGDMGPMYGWNWRHFGAKYIDKDTDYSNKGFDQLRDIIDKLANDKTSRRIVMTAFDPSKVSEAVLPPCHSMVLQFYVEDNQLSLQMYQRSSDSFLGLPFNISQHALLLRLMCEISGLKPHRLKIVLGDVHVYESHLNAVKEQLNRCSYEFPKLDIINKYEGDFNDVDQKIKYLEGLKYEDFHISEYTCGSTIKANMIA